MESPKKSLASFIVCSWTICLDSWIPRLSLSRASLVCLSVTLSPFRTLRCNPTVAPPARTLEPRGPRSDDADADHLTLVVAYLFDDRAGLVFSPAHHPALVVKVLLLDRQVGGAPDHVLVGDLTALVEGRLDDVPGIVDRALHRLARVVGSLAEQTFDLLRPSGSLSSLTCRILCLARGVLRLLGRLPRSVGRSLRGLAGRIRGALGDLTGRVSRPFCSLTYLFGGLAGRIADALGDLACGLTRILRRLTRALADFAGCLACALTDFTCRLAGAFSHFADGLARALANVLYGFSRALDRLTGSLADIFHGLAGALDGFTGAFANIFHGGACSFAYVLHGGARAGANVFYSRAGTLAHVFDCGAGTRADILNGGSCTRSHVFDRGTRAGANVLYSRAGAFADVLNGGSCTRSDICHGLIGTFSDELSRSFSDILYGRVHTLAHELTRAGANIFDRGAGSFADIFYCRAHAFGQLLDDLGVAVYGRENPVEDGGQVVQPGFQERLRFYPLYDQLDPAQVHVGPDGELDQVEHLGVHRELRPQVVEFEVDLIDLDHGYVEQHVGDLAVHHGVFLIVLQRVVRVCLLRHRPVAWYVARVPVLFVFLNRGARVVLTDRDVVLNFLQARLVPLLLLLRRGVRSSLLVLLFALSLLLSLAFVVRLLGVVRLIRAVGCHSLDLFVRHAVCSLFALPSCWLQELIFHALLG